MTDRDFNRARQGRQNDNDWDWDYYYEYRYYPYSSYRANDYDRDYYDRNYYDRNYRYGRNYSDRDYYGNYYGREDYYDRDYDYYGSYPYRSSTYGRYYGVGPRGYQRSDERIREDINDRLTWHGGIDATDIQVDVNDSVVTLKGTVDDRRQKRMAENVAENVFGVDDVNNQLQIRNRGGNRGGGSSMSGMSDQIHEGMKVVGRNGNEVGEVKEVRSNDFLVDRSMARDVYVPFSACQKTDGQIRLNVAADDVDNQGWEMPDLMAAETSQKSSRKR
jgi:hypothetical protein